MYILNQINKTYTWTCLGYEFCFEQQIVIFFPALIHLPQAKQKPWMLLFSFFFSYNQLLFFFGNSINVYCRGDLQYSLSTSLTLQYKN